MQRENFNWGLLSKISNLKITKKTRVYEKVSLIDKNTLNKLKILKNILETPGFGTMELSTAMRVNTPHAATETHTSVKIEA